jgi:murein L,D-transpeptidase YafK
MNNIWKRVSISAADIWKRVSISTAGIWKRVSIVAAGAGFLILLIVLMIHYVPSPPVRAMEKAREALSLARRNNADSYSRSLFKEAGMYYNSALLNWRKENERFIYSRNYSKVIKYAELSANKSKQATENSKTNSSNLKSKTNEKIKTLNTIVADLTQRFNDYPLTTEVRNRISKGKFLLKESEIACQKGQYLQANKKLTESEYLLTNSYENANENLKRYFRSYPDWKRWIDSTIAESRDSRDYSIIVDKFSRKVYVYLDGTKQYEYSAELGRNWVGDKKVKGDKATPEGIYKITRKFRSDSTKYYKALLINYPNDEDTAFFEKAKAKGILPPSAMIGGMIEIHGNGGKGIDWTEGCIALTDREMDSLFKIAKVGTTVTIVGSMNDLKHVLKR